MYIKCFQLFLAHSNDHHHMFFYDNQKGNHNVSSKTMGHQHIKRTESITFMHEMERHIVIYGKIS